MPARNLITDVPGVRVGHAEDTRLASGVTVIVFDEPASPQSTCAAAAPVPARPISSTPR